MDKVRISSNEVRIPPYILGEDKQKIFSVGKVGLSDCWAFVIDDETSSGGTLLAATYVLVKELGLSWGRVLSGVIHAKLSRGLKPFETGLNAVDAARLLDKGGILDLRYINDKKRLMPPQSLFVTKSVALPEEFPEEYKVSIASLVSYAVKKIITNHASIGKSVFIGYQNHFTQEETDKLAMANATGKVYRILDVKGQLIDLIGKDKGRIYLGPGACYTGLLKRILSASLQELAKKHVNIAITHHFGRFACILGNTIYLDSIFEEVIEEAAKESSLRQRHNHFFRAKAAILFAIFAHENKHYPRILSDLADFDEELDAGLAELEVYILAGRQFRLDILDFLEKEFKGQEMIIRDASYIINLANLYDINENKKALDFYYVPGENDKNAVGIFTGKGKGSFVGEVFLSLRGERQIPQKLREFYRYLSERKGEGKISSREVGFAILSVSDNLNDRGYDPALRQELEREIENKRWDLLMESYREEAEFGTAGIRGKRGLEKDLDGESIPYLPGPNRINQDVAGRYTLAIANYITKNRLQSRGVVVGFDVRKGSRELAQISKDILLRKGIEVYWFHEPRPISEIALAVPHKGAYCYIYITASHNPKSDTGFKIGNEIGAQLFGAQRAAIIKEIAPVSMSEVDNLKHLASVSFNKPVMMLEGAENFDEVFSRKIQSHLLSPSMPKTLNVLYDPVFGTGQSVLPKIFGSLGYKYSVYSPHEGFNGDFPDPKLVNKEGKPLSPDPADKRVLGPAIEYATQHGFDVVVATDPDADRCGLAFKDNKDSWQVMTANDLWAFLAWSRIEFMYDLASQGKLAKPYQALLRDGFIIVTWVTSDLIEKIARAHGFHVRRPPVGFGKIAEEALDEIILKDWFKSYSLDFESFGDRYKEGLQKISESMRIPEVKTAIEEIFAFARSRILGGFEESNGVSLGGHTLEKDGLLAAVVMLELFEYVRSKGFSIWDSFLKLWRSFGCFVSANEQYSLAGPTAKVDRDKVMNKVEEVYRKVKSSGKVVIAGRMVKEAHRGVDITAPKFNEPGYKFIFEDGSWLVIRPSGTEPKMRFYAQAEIHSAEFEGRNDDDLSEIRLLEEGKITRFALDAIKEIRDLTFAGAELKDGSTVTKARPRNLAMFDIDGTIAERRKPLSGSMTSQIKELIGCGMLVGINTGNMLDEDNISRIVEPFNDCSDNFVIAANASTQIFYFEGGVRREDLGYRKGIPQEIKAKAVSIIKEVCARVALEEALSYEGFIFEDRITRIAIRNDALKGDKDISSRVRQHLSQGIRDAFESEGIFGLEACLEGKTTVAVTPAGINKAEALKYIYAKYGIQPQNIIYFGDEFSQDGNDLAVTSVQGIKIFSVGPQTEAPRRVTGLGEGINFTESSLVAIGNFIRKHGLNGLRKFIDSPDFVGKVRQGVNTYPSGVTYPFSVPAKAQEDSVKQFGRNWQSGAVEVAGFNLRGKFPSELIQGREEVMIKRLAELEQLLGRAPPELANWRLIITTDLSLTQGNVAACGSTGLTTSDITAKTVFIHPYFFSLNDSLQLKILYHELISHITKGITDEDEAMGDTEGIVPYIKIALAFWKMMEMSEEKLKTVLPGLRDHKYTLGIEGALPFEGISVIHNIDKVEVGQ
ncbi:MAG: HAD-IIB family hydrolase [Candidatus Omnitrophota bacterium]|jgi:phosphoglucomutase